MTTQSEQTASLTFTARRRVALGVIVVGNLLQSFGFQLWRALFNNFAVEELGVSAGQIGLIQSIREIPGLLGFTVGLLALILSEMRIAELSVVLLGLGVLLTGTVHGLTGLIVSTFIMSIGFHFFMSGNSSAVMLLVGERESPRWLGRLSSLGALAAVVGAAVVFLALDRLGFRAMFYLTGAVVIVGGLLLMPWGRQPEVPGYVRLTRSQRRASIRKEYWLYYLLEFLMGSRRHIFTTFAIFLLVETHHVSAHIITALFVINNILGTFLFRQFGGIIRRFGERQVLAMNFLMLILVFLGYAYIPSLPVLYILFIADHLLFGFRIALKSYLQKIALHPREITPNVSLGQTINHIAAVVVPLVGGRVWEILGSVYTFLFGVGIVMASLVLVQWMKTERQNTAPA